MRNQVMLSANKCMLGVVELQVGIEWIFSRVRNWSCCSAIFNNGIFEPNKVINRIHGSYFSAMLGLVNAGREFL